MDQRRTKPKLLARIPDLNAAALGKSLEEPQASNGRFISQSLSFKLLAASVLLLVVGAVFLKGRSSDPSATLEPLPAWRSQSPVPATDAAAALPAPATQLPVTVPNPPPMPGVLAPPVVASAPPAPATTEAPIMSSWPNPAYPTTSPEAGGEEPRAGVNQAMAIRPLEHVRSSHDRTRSSIH